jgi:zinc-binding alcohol dehydrogenase/oxidoreductase
MDLLEPGGRLVNCGCTLGNWARVNVARMLFDETAILASVLGPKHEFLDLLLQVEQANLKPIVDRTFPLERTRDAVEYLASGRQFGKVIVIPDVLDDVR